MVEQQIDEKLVTTHIQQHLPADEGEASTQFQQKFSDVLDQRILDGTLTRFAAQAKKVEAIRVFQGFARQVRLRRRQGG